jgi:DNA-binding MarR family transcriptional regulator
MLLARHGNVSGGELARLLGVGLAALSGMIDRLVQQDLVTRTEDLHDRRVRRIGLTRKGGELIGSIFNAGEARCARSSAGSQPRSWTWSPGRRSCS